MTRNEPPRKPLISTRWLLALGVIFVLFGIVMIVFFPNIK
jgi:hypothetical protein